jgi:hypothetical protein
MGRLDFAPALTDPQTGNRYGLTVAQWTALAAMPVTLTDTGRLSLLGPTANTLHALEARGLVVRDGNRWVRTALGERVWENR